jgi:hypothetical protein
MLGRLNQVERKDVTRACHLLVVFATPVLIFMVDVRSAVLKTIWSRTPVQPEFAASRSLDDFVKTMPGS